MPDGWGWCKLNELADIARGGSPRPIENYITDSPDGINWIKIGDTAPESKYIESAKEKIKPEGQKHSRFVHEGDFLLTNSMSFGRPYILKINGCIHDGWLVFANIKECVIKDYLYYALSSDYIYASFSMVAAGSTVKNLKSDTVKQVLFPLPPIKTQEKIVESIEKSFTQIDILDNEKLDLQAAIKQAKSKILDLAIHGKLVPQDLNDEPAEELLKRIATSDNRPYEKVEDEPFEIPDSWRWVKLGFIVDILDSKRKPITKSERKSGIYPYYGATCIQDYVSDYLFDEDLLLLGEDGAKWGKGEDSAFCIHGKTWVNNHAHVLRTLQNIDMFYLCYVLIILDLTPYITGTTVPKLNQLNMSQITIPLPPIKEQKKIVDKIEQLFNHLDQIQNNLV